MGLQLKCFVFRYEVLRRALVSAFLKETLTSITLVFYISLLNKITINRTDV
jgi:hypothetical protein